MFAEAVGTAVLVTAPSFARVHSTARREEVGEESERRNRNGGSAVEEECKGTDRASGDVHSRRIACRSVRAMGVRVCAAPRC